MKVNKTIFLLVVGLMILPAFGDGIHIDLSGTTNENMDEPGVLQIALSATFHLTWNQGSKTLSVWVTNNSPDPSDISEIYLNLPIGSGITGMIMSVSNGGDVTADWINVFDPDNAGAAHDQYGIFDFGAKLKKNKTGGIPAGSDLHFEFTFEGSLATLTAEDFESALSIPELDGPVSSAEAKWLHLADEQSGWGGALAAPTPEPGTLLLLGSGLLAGGSFLRKKFKR